MNEPVFVACDMGTTLVKAAVIDLGGRVLATVSVPSRLDRPSPGVIEQDLLEIERQAHLAIGRAVSRSGRAADIAGVSFSSQMSGIGALGADFLPTAPFDSWLDSRCSRDIYEMAPRARRVTELSGCPPTYSHGTKIRWMQRERAAAYARTAVFQVPGAYVAARLAGLGADGAFVDRPNLCFSNLSDTERGEWSEELVESFGIDGAKLPRIVDSLSVVGTVTRAASEATGIPEGVPVAAGCGDQVVACLGAGVVASGRASDSAGTASLFSMCLDRWAPDTERMSMVTATGVIPGTYLSFSFVNGGGLGPEWVRSTIADHPGTPEEAFGDLGQLASEVPAGSDGLIWLPHFQGGVLPPKPYLRSGWVGLTSAHGRGHLYRSVLEGIAYQYAAWADRAPAITGEPLSEVRAMGGGAKSDLWVLIKADVLGVPFVRMPKSECALLGGALVAAAATGHVRDIAGTIDSWHELSDPVQPHPARHARYRRYVEVFDELSAQVDPTFRRLQEIADDPSA
ncbi:MAG: FGGY-family carbohydrate kinase [Leucobacter sp.]